VDRNYALNEFLSSCQRGFPLDENHDACDYFMYLMEIICIEEKNENVMATRPAQKQAGKVKPGKSDAATVVSENQTWEIKKRSAMQASGSYQMNSLTLWIGPSALTRTVNTEIQQR
jgi:hypothetical protein